MARAGKKPTLEQRRRKRESNKRSITERLHARMELSPYDPRDRALIDLFRSDDPAYIASRRRQIEKQQKERTEAAAFELLSMAETQRHRSELLLLEATMLQEEEVLHVGGMLFSESHAPGCNCTGCRPPHRPDCFCPGCREEDRGPAWRRKVRAWAAASGGAGGDKSNAA